MSRKINKSKAETPISSNIVADAKLTKSNSRNSYEMCQELGINDVELEWSEVDYENLTSFNIFCRMIRPQLAAANNKLAPNLMNQILEMKWKEFQKANPLNKQADSSEYDSENQEANNDQNIDNHDDDNQDDCDNQEDNDNVSEKQDESDEEDDKNASATSEESEEETSKSKAKKASNKSLKIRFSLKQPVRKSSREIKPVHKKMDEATEDEDSQDEERSSEDVCPTKRIKQKPINDSQESDFSSKDSNSENGSISEDEDGNQKSKKTTLKPQIPGERKSNRSKRSNPSMRELTDREFEKMLASQAAVQEEKNKKKSKTTKKKKEKHSGARFTASKLHQLKQQNNSDNSDVEKSDHVWFCELCKDGGDLLLCDTCPKSFHKECLKLEQVPEGDWSCPVCTGEGLPEKGDSSEEDNHEAFCRFCKDGGDVILCDFCPLVYHLDCLNPPLTNPPNGDWKCPICKVIENPIKSKVKCILTWRWKNQPKNIDELDHTPQKKVHDSTVKKNTKKMPEREYFCKFEYHSYWDCEWIDEIRMEVHEKMLYLSFKKKFDLSEPPALEDGSSYGRQRNKNLDEDPHNLEQRFYRYGVKPDWLQIHHIIAHDGKGPKDRRYLVKWRELGYSDCTWESVDSIAEELEGFDKHVEIYWERRKQRTGKDGIKPENLKKSLLRKRLEQQPDYIEECGGRLHPYQLEGLNWLRFSWSQGTNTILADEMGLGKTIQAISFLFSLYKEGYVTHKPFLVSAPLSTVPNWEREFEFWAPELYVVTYTGQKENRVVIREHEFSYKEGAFRYSGRSSKMREGHRVKFDVLLTSYEYISVDNCTFSGIPWGVLIIDEAHRLKNNQSLFFRTLQDYKIDYKLLLTGTPLQNNLEELFNLLNFLEPNKFMNMEEFLSEFSEISKDEQVLKLHDMLAPHMLRRMKTDVLKDIPSKSEFIVRIELSAMQKKYYKYILTKNYEALNAKGYSNQTSLLNIMMDLRKCCNHPYLFPGAEKDAQLTSTGAFDGVAIMKASGKLEMLDRMLRILKRDQHRVLIFSQMTRMLDLLEDYLSAFGYGYERIDGSIAGSKRQEAIDRFNATTSKNFIFLLSTRAGGLGINLATADTVIIYDMDWNPHNDIQAFSRAHRIGQKNKVMIYRFVTRNTVEEKIATVCKQKMMLSELIVHRGMGSSTAHSIANEKRDSLTKQEISDILKYGAENLFTDDEEGQVVYNDEAVEKLLDRSQEGEAEKEKEFGMNEYLRSFKVASYQVKEGVEDEEEEEVVEEVVEEKTDVDTGTNVESDVAYWQRVLGPSYHEHVVQTLKEQEEIAKTLGKGKRVRKQINYAEREMMNDAESKAKLKKLTDAEFTNASDYEPTDSSDSDVQSNAEVDGDNSPKKKKVKMNQPQLRTATQALPALVERVEGQVLVLGFTARQRRAFLDAVMRFGMPPNDPYRSQWLVRDLRGKPERVFKAYVSLFMRHLCEPVTENSEKYSDGVPKEGLSRQHVLTRIGIIALIRKKVHEFEAKNGIDSMLEFNSRNHPSIDSQTTGSTGTLEPINIIEKVVSAEAPSHKDVAVESIEIEKDNTNTSSEIPAKKDSEFTDTSIKDIEQNQCTSVDANEENQLSSESLSDKCDRDKFSEIIEVSSKDGKLLTEENESSVTVSCIEPVIEQMDVDLELENDKVTTTLDNSSELQKKIIDECPESSTANSINDTAKQDTDEKYINHESVNKDNNELTKEDNLITKDVSKEKELSIEEATTKKNETIPKNEGAVPMELDGTHLTIDDFEVYIEDGEGGVKQIDSKQKTEIGALPEIPEDDLRRKFWISDGGFTELHALWQLEELQIVKGKAQETWHRRHDYWLLAGVITHGYRHWQDILTDPRFDLLNQAFRTELERSRKAAFLNRRFQLLEQALVVEEQLRKAIAENVLPQPPSVDVNANDANNALQRLLLLDELANQLKSMSEADIKSQKPPKMHKLLNQIASLVSDINDMTYANMPASLSKSYSAASTLRPVVNQVRPNRPITHWSGLKNSQLSVVPPTRMQMPAPSSVQNKSQSPLTGAMKRPAPKPTDKSKDVICID